jgi:hypothetical protein
MIEISFSHIPFSQSTLICRANIASEPISGLFHMHGESFVGMGRSQITRSLSGAETRYQGKRVDNWNEPVKPVASVGKFSYGW